MSSHFEGWPHVMVSQQFSRPWLEKEFFPLTDQMEKVFNEGGCEILKGKRMASLFYQPSTRTRASFEFAMDYLGGRTVFSTENAREFSSAKKGETLSHTIKALNRYRPDLIVLRYDRENGAEIAANISRAPILNAGDRDPGQHPTQALLDLRTIFKCFGFIDGISIAMVGDLINGRTLRSLAYLLGKFNGVRIYFVSPPNARIGSDVKEYLCRHEVKFTELSDLRDIAKSVDVIYQTRTQEECGIRIDRKDHDLGYFIIDKGITTSMKPNARIMHPLPLVDEITPEVDEDPRSV